MSVTAIPASARIAAMFDHTTAACSPRSAGHRPVGRDRHHAGRVQQPPAALAEHGVGVAGGGRGDRGRHHGAVHAAILAPDRRRRGRAVACAAMALIEQSPTEHVAADVPTIDGVPLTPKATSLDGIPTFATVEEERAAPQAEARRRAAHLRPLRLRRGRRRPHHGARPRVPRPLLGQPVRPQLPPHARQRPHPRQPPRRGRVRLQAGEPGGVRAALGDPPGPARRRRRRPLALAVRQGVLARSASRSPR